MKFSEKCACGSAQSIPMPQGANGDWGDWAMAQLKDWRENHRHEFPPAEPEPEELPLIHESGSSHELSGVPYDEGRPPVTIGFQWSEVR